MDYNEIFEYKDGKIYNKADRTQRSKKGDEIGCFCNGYKIITLNRRTTRVHRIIWEMHNGKIPKGLQVDHINGKKDDNRIENLQLLTNKQNSQRKNNSKGYTIVKQPFPYRAQKIHLYKQNYMGNFGTPCGAYMANRMFFITQ